MTNVRGYCHYLRQAARLDDATESAYRKLRNQKLAAEIELARLRLQVHKKELHTAAGIEFGMTLMLTALKSRLLAIPSRTARLLIGKTFGELYALLLSEFELALRELSTCDPNSFVPENEEYLTSACAPFGQPDGNGGGNIRIPLSKARVRGRSSDVLL